MDNVLLELATRLGIVTKFIDAGLVRKEYDVDEKTIKFFANKLGYKTGSEDEIKKSIADFDKKRWQKTLENVYVVEQEKVVLDAVIPSSKIDETFAVTLKNKLYTPEFDVSFEVVNTNEINTIGKTSYTKMRIVITSDLDVGYYELTLKVGDKNYKTTLAVAPQKCFENEALEHGKIWGYAVQLYSIKSDRNWGVGDFTDLCDLVRISKKSGAEIIGLNPLNVLFHDYPENASPYSSISRLFLNPIYIDVEVVPEFVSEDKNGIEGQLAEVRNSEIIQYGNVYPLKMQIMEKLYSRFKSSKNKERKDAFKKFCQEQECELDNLALFQTLYEVKSKTIWGGWNAWEEEYKNPNSVAVKTYAKEHADRIEFFKFLQFEADRQFNQAQNMVKECDMKIGFYRDLAVGVGKDSAEVWSEQDLFIKDAGAGAPPDFLNPQGQKWCLGAFNPFMLKEKAYDPFIKILRANMNSAGTLRIDHVMSLMRLYVIPDDKDIGTYIMYNFNDMLNIVAIESHLNQCSVVGESIGNVPEGFLASLERKNIHSLSVLWAERWDVGRGDFKSPYDYPEGAFTSIGTHDMAPLRMWWFGYDIAQFRELGIMESDEAMHEAYKQREIDRWKLLFALDSNCVWPEDNLRKANYLYGEAYPEGIEEATHRFVARSVSKVFLAQIEDILHVEKMQNLPGTDRDKHPNWRRKIPVSLEKLEGDIAFIRNIAAIRQER